MANLEADLLTVCDLTFELLEFYKNRKTNLLALWKVLKNMAGAYDLMQQYRRSDKAQRVKEGYMLGEIGGGRSRI